MAISDIAPLAMFPFYFIFFWKFIFRKGYRSETFQRWRQYSTVKKLWIPLEIFVATFCGITPFVLFYVLIFIE